MPDVQSIIQQLTALETEKTALNERLITGELTSEQQAQISQRLTIIAAEIERVKTAANAPADAAGAQLAAAPGGMSWDKIKTYLIWTVAGILAYKFVIKPMMAGKPVLGLNGEDAEEAEGMDERGVEDDSEGDGHDGESAVEEPDQDDEEDEE